MQVHLGKWDFCGTLVSMPDDFDRGCLTRSRGTMYQFRVVQRVKRWPLHTALEWMTVRYLFHTVAVMSSSQSGEQVED